MDYGGWNFQDLSRILYYQLGVESGINRDNSNPSHHVYTPLKVHADVHDWPKIVEGGRGGV